jgi:hypothetical protein
LSALESESDRLQERISSGQIASATGNSYSKTQSTREQGITLSDLASFLGELLVRYEWACSRLEITTTPTDAQDTQIYDQMVDDMAVRPPTGAPNEVHYDFTLLRTA